MRRKLNGRVSRGIILAALTILGILCLYPLFYALLGSLTSPEEFLHSSVLPIPSDPFANLSNYVTIFREPTLLRSIIITLLRIGVNFIIMSLTSLFGGFVFAKIDFPFRRTMFMILLSTLMFPAQALLVPNYIWMAKFPLFGGNNILGQGGHGLVNNVSYYFVTGWVSVFNIFLFRQMLVSMDNGLAESAKIDGCGFLSVVLRIYMPLLKPLFVVLFVGCFVGFWNEYTNIIVMMPDNSFWHTVGVAAIDLAGYYMSPSHAVPMYPQAYAIHVTMMVVPIIIFSFLQKYFVEGLMAGAIKG